MRSIVGFLIGAILAGAAALGLGIIALSLGLVSNREGAAAMGIIFFITPVAALFGGIAGAVIGILRER